MNIRDFFSKDTKLGRAVRTFLQAFAGILSFAIGLLALPGLDSLLNAHGFAVTATTLAGWIGVVSYIYNKIEELIQYIWGS